MLVETNTANTDRAKVIGDPIVAKQGEENVVVDLTRESIEGNNGRVGEEQKDEAPVNKAYENISDTDEPVDLAVEKMPIAQREAHEIDEAEIPEEDDIQALVSSNCEDSTMDNSSQWAS